MRAFAIHDKKNCMNWSHYRRLLLLWKNVQKRLKHKLATLEKISKRTLKELTLLALNRLDQIIKVYDYRSTNMLNLMILSVEHLHAESHIKQPLLTQLQYARDFMPTLKESIKRSSYRSASYFTSRKASWYQSTDYTICLNNVLKDLQKKKSLTKITQN